MVDGDGSSSVFSRLFARRCSWRRPARGSPLLAATVPSGRCARSTPGSRHLDGLPSSPDRCEQVRWVPTATRWQDRQRSTARRPRLAAQRSSGPARRRRPTCRVRRPDRSHAWPMRPPARACCSRATAAAATGREESSLLITTPVPGSDRARAADPPAPRQRLRRVDQHTRPGSRRRSAGRPGALLRERRPALARTGRRGAAAGPRETDLDGHVEHDREVGPQLPGPVLQARSGPYRCPAHHPDRRRWRREAIDRTNARGEGGRMRWACARTGGDISSSSVSLPCRRPMAQQQIADGFPSGVHGLAVITTVLPAASRRACRNACAGLPAPSVPSTVMNVRSCASGAALV